MQTTLAAGAAAREEQRVKRASQEGYAAATTDAVIDARHKGKKEPQNLWATYQDGDVADAHFEEHYAAQGGHQGNQQLVVQHNDNGELMMPFAGFYDEVTYPVTTLFYPPHAPGELPPRVQIPPRPGPVYKNDLALCGERENEAQRIVSKMWRGVLTRRNLQSNRTFEHILNYRARMIQCWWRTVLARRRRNQLAALKKEWAQKRSEDYIAEKQKGMQNMMTWQRRRFEGAAVKLQQVIRWHLNYCARNRCQQEGLPADKWPSEVPSPVPHKLVCYFPWRRRVSEVVVAVDGGAPSEKKSTDEEPRRRTILEFKKEREPVKPPPQAHVETNNALMRRKTRDRAVSLAQPEVQSRREWKQEGLRHEDLDFNAGVIQRLFRSQRSGSKVRTVELAKTYMDRVVRVIARTFRMYILVQHLKVYRRGIERKVRERLTKYSRAKIEDIDHKVVWGKELLDASARTIQQCWHWYRYSRFGILPLRIQKELDRRESLARQKQELAEERRRQREETIRKLQEELGVTPEAGTEAAASNTADAEAEPEVPLTEEELQQQHEERRKAKEEQERAEEEKRRAEDAVFAELDEPYEYDEPAAPPYRLIDDYLAREEELRDAMMNLLERNKKQMVKSHKYATFTPENPIVRKSVNTFIPKTN